MVNERNSPRRRLLKRGAMLLGGAAGLGLLARGEVAATPSTGGGVLTLSVHGGDWRLTYPDRRRGILPQPGERSNSFGQLFSGPEGEKIGEFYASSFTFGAPFGPSDMAAAAMEMHHFNLADGTIVGMGTIGGFHDTTSVHAIIGGTGRYEGASGSYTARQSPVELGGDGTADFTFSINLRSA